MGDDKRLNVCLLEGKNMNTNLKLMALVSVSMLPAIASGHAQTVNCAGMPAELSQLNDGALFYRIGTVRRHAAWAPLSQGDQLDIARPTFVEFIYVAKEN